jgi:hypothetical protein
MIQTEGDEKYTPALGNFSKEGIYNLIRGWALCLVQEESLLMLGTAAAGGGA